MAFYFTPEDFVRYVRQDGHGGRHIWHDIQDRLELAFGLPFKAWPYEARGDRIKLLWFDPRGTPRIEWKHQAMFSLQRDIDAQTLSFGFKIERPPSEYFDPSNEKYSTWESDCDWHRFSRLLGENSEFREYFSRILESAEWKVSINPWGSNPSIRHPSSLSALESAIDAIPEDSGIDLYVEKKLTAQQAIESGEQITDYIVDAYCEIGDIWAEALPLPVQESIAEAIQALNESKGRNSIAYARQVIEELLPESESRRQCLELMADYLLAAHAESENCWSITLFPNLVRLNIGQPEAYVIGDEQIHLLFCRGQITQTNLDEVSDIGDLRHKNYLSVPEAYDTYFAYGSIADIKPLIEQGLPEFLARAVPTGRKTRHQNAHSEGVVKYLREELHRDIPSPAYVTEGASNNGRITSAMPQATIQMLNTFSQSISAAGLRFSDWQLGTFLTAMQTKGFVILSGPTGTGKSKLAQHFAAMLPRPWGVDADPDDYSISVTIQPYMLKYNRITVPKDALRYFDPPDAGETTEVLVRFDGSEQRCRFTHASYPGTNYLQLLLRGDARKWFAANYKLNDRVRLQPQTDDEGELIGLDFLTDGERAHNHSSPRKPVPNWLFVPVRPDWRDSKSMLGYYNPLSGDYVWTEFLRFVLRAVDNFKSAEPTAWILILDEMNLARVEYYFADLLSIMESGRDSDGWTREPLRFDYPEDATGELPPREVSLPPNLYVVGTVNADETTHAFSPKVLDRAFTTELYDVDFNNYPPAVNNGFELTDESRRQLLELFAFNGRFHRIDKRDIAGLLASQPRFRSHLATLNELLRPHDLQFGYRTFDEIIAFVDIAVKNKAFEGLGDTTAAFDAAVLMKVLPKFHGTRNRLDQPLRELLGWCANPSMPRQLASDIDERASGDDRSIDALSQSTYEYQQTAERIIRMLRSLEHSGFASFG